MKLLSSPTSPYARKCKALILEKSLETRIHVEELNPLDDPGELHAANPLGKVPALVRDNAPAIVGSAAICDYIDTLNDETWIPARGESRTLVMRQQALADGLLDLTVGRRLETNRDDELRYPYWIERWERAITRTLDVLEDSERSRFERSVDLGALAVAVALGYLDFRYPEFDWREGRPGLAEFAEKWFARESFVETAPPKSA
ncbi:glutathione S-transferase [Marinicauda salina]|uniref:Glutathione S-transferase n=1 Tax=Marinicauda salina TaxID=2135793 RepID=A0A2U2BTH7_9PROT|nr:glutathione S-transferase family protein [Marinicauda salina]PWE17290.1 glutathione S-transferase [Marinicauda salina]